MLGTKGVQSGHIIYLDDTRAMVHNPREKECGLANARLHGSNSDEISLPHPRTQLGELASFSIGGTARALKVQPMRRSDKAKVACVTIASRETTAGQSISAYVGEVAPFLVETTAEGMFVKPMRSQCIPVRRTRSLAVTCTRLSGFEIFLANRHRSNVHVVCVNDIRLHCV